ncbi:NUDIX domain-containing protein [Plantactinospora sp. WMMB782]|uniref:NUDIX domain-containing protein n=1 Tax=Plantactinospora sp. WMMB782 TaxID=3404121 RepID=UPI003B947C97
MNAPVTYTDPEVLAAAARGESWADPEADPCRIDWTARQVACPLAFEPGFDLVDGRPRYPYTTTSVRYGRNQLGHWGPQLCVDAVVSLHAKEIGGRWLLLVERGDGHGWALPGGYVDPGEDPTAAAIRELREETGFDGAAFDWERMPARYVPDPRASDEAWMVVIPVWTHLGTYYREYFPHVEGADDARRAAWVPADSYADLVWYLTGEYGGQVFAAHVPLLRELLDGTAS